MTTFVADRRALLFALLPSAFACATTAAAIVATGATPSSPPLAVGMTALAIGSLATAAWLARRPEVRYPTWPMPHDHVHRNKSRMLGFTPFGPL